MVTKKNVPLSTLVYYKIGGNARFVLEAFSVDDIFEAVAFIQRNKIKKFLVVGLGANLLMPDEDYDGVILHLRSAVTPDMHVTSDGLLTAFSGQTLDDLIQFSFAHHFIGLERLGGLPSTIGGAIRGNAGAFGVEMKDVVVKVSALKLTEGSFKTVEMTNEECQFAYRDSIFKKTQDFIILKGFFHLEPVGKEAVRQAREEYHAKIQYRKKQHPVEYPSCGSVFKNIRGEDQVKKILTVWPDISEKVMTDWHGKVSMGYVIKRLGFSGTQSGGAKITEKHANYISNVDHARAADVKNIIGEISAKFSETFGFVPELEAEIIE